MPLQDASTQTENLQGSMMVSTGGVLFDGDMMMKNQDRCDTESTSPLGFVEHEDKHEELGVSKRWTRTILMIRKPMMLGLHAVTSTVSRRPKLTIGISVLLSLFLMIVGLLTNFTLVVDENELWTPTNAKSVQHQDWIDEFSGFPVEPRPLYFSVHADGENILGTGKTMDSIDRTFQVLDAIRGLDGYDDICAQSDFVDEQGRKTCQIHGVTKFWNHTSDAFRSAIETDDDALSVISGRWYPDLTPVIDDNVFGLPQRNSQGQLTSATMFLFQIGIPDVDEAEDFEKTILDELLGGLRHDWASEPANALRLEVTAVRSFADEFARAIDEDIILVPGVFVMMSVFTCLVFFRKHRVHSRTLLALAAIASIILSIVAGYGLLFLVGVPLTNITTIVPFIILGVGLDDAFIIAGEYGRSDVTKGVEERIFDTIEECGFSICLTTITSATAFGLGCISSVPAIYWLCLYALTAILLVLTYQVTFFVACIVLDEERIKQNRLDCCFCVTVHPEDEGGRSEDNSTSAAASSALLSGRSGSLMPRFVSLLLRPWTQALVIAGFLAFGAACAVSATKLRQEFNFVDVLPKGSYVSDFFLSLEDYTTRTGLNPFVYFRYVDQSDEDIQRQMEEYIDDLVTIDAVVSPPPFCWVYDFQNFVKNDPNLPLFADFLGTNLTFQDQLDLFLANPVYNFLYGDNIVRDEKTGGITASRCRFFMDNITIGEIRQEMKALTDQRSVTKAQPINQGTNDWSFFTLDSDIYNIWEFYVVSVQQLTLTTITGIASVTGIALFLIPHWSAAPLVLPLMMLLYIDLLGVLQWAGVTINPVSYVTLVLSIGLMVDYLMHILVRYYESPGNRKEKTREALETMGVSILLGGVSTFLGTIPLAFSASSTFMTVFYAFLALVTLGCSHGLILLPVLLSLFGTEDQTIPEPKPEQQKTAVSEQAIVQPEREVADQVFA